MWISVALSSKAVKGQDINLPYVDGQPSEEFYFDNHVAKALEKDGFLNETWDKFDALFDWGDCDYFDSKKCIKFRKWLIYRLKKPVNDTIRPVYETMLDYANKAIKYHTGIYFNF